jgi:hypothetical protein
VVWCSNPTLARAAGLPDRLPVAPGMFSDWQPLAAAWLPGRRATQVDPDGGATGGMTGTTRAYGAATIPFTVAAGPAFLPSVGVTRQLTLFFEWATPAARKSVSPALVIVRTRRLFTRHS